jgi:two-component system cell cycle sensor histidine kinase/response regulator CckA
MVMVVEDDARVREVVRRTLQWGGYAVIEAADGTEAVGLLTDRIRVDLLLVELEMPGLPGEEVARWFRAARRDLKVLFVSGVTDRLFANRPLSPAAEAFLEKPFTQSGLLEAVALLLFGTRNTPADWPWDILH